MARGQPNGRRKGAKNYTIEELFDLACEVNEVLPINSNDWDKVVAVHLVKYRGENRDQASLKRKFNSIATQKGGTGNPNCPEYIKIAKQAHKAIYDKAMLSDGSDGSNILAPPPPCTQPSQEAAQPTLGQPTQSSQRSTTNDDDSFGANFDGDDDEMDPEEYAAVVGTNGVRRRTTTGSTTPTTTPTTTAAAITTPTPTTTPTTTTTISSLTRRSAQMRGRRNNMGDNIVQVMMMEMHQRQLEYQERMVKMEQERLDQREEQNQSRMLMAHAIDTFAQAFMQATSGTNNNNQAQDDQEE